MKIKIIRLFIGLRLLQAGYRIIPTDEWKLRDPELYKINYRYKKPAAEEVWQAPENKGL